MESTDKKNNYSSKSTQVLSLEKGKLPPQAVDLEEVILGAMMIDKKGLYQVMSILHKEVFYKEAHQNIFEAIYELFEKSEPVDLLTVSQKLKEHNNLDLSGGEYYLIQLTQKVSSSAHIEYHARIIIQMYVKRKAIQVSNNIIELSYNEDTDIFELLAKTQRDIDDVASGLIKKSTPTIKTISDRFFEEKENKTGGVPSGLFKLNLRMNGYRNADLIIVAARPGMGKTAFMLSEAKSMAKKGIPVGVFSLEMTDIQLFGRMMSDECEIDSSKIARNKLDDFEKRLLKEKKHLVDELPIYINDTPGISPMEVKIEASKWVREHGVKMLFIDYLQLMSASGKANNGNREQEISYISRTLKGIAKELDIPVMALSQLSRAVESRGGMKRPMLSDLRESGAIEQDADIVLFPFRAEYYKIDEWDDDERTPTKNQMEIGIAKFRGGETGDTYVGCNLQFMRIFDLEDPFFQRMKSEETYIPPLPKPIQPNEAFDTELKSLKEEDDDGIPF